MFILCIKFILNILPLPKLYENIYLWHICSCMLCCTESLSCVWLFATPWTEACQAALSKGILQARILECVAMPSSRGSSQPRGRTQVSHIAGTFFIIWATREALEAVYILSKDREIYFSFFSSLLFFSETDTAFRTKTYYSLSAKYVPDILK